MKNQLGRTISILGLFFVLAIVSVQAQTPSRVETNIPFDFTAGKAKLKAGTYSLKKISGSTLAIRSADGQTRALINAPLTIGSRDFRGGERLVFNKYGDRYFLTQVWLSADSGRQLFTSGTETDAAREYQRAHNNTSPERVEIAIR